MCPFFIMPEGQGGPFLATSQRRFDGWFDVANDTWRLRISWGRETTLAQRDAASVSAAKLGTGSYSEPSSKNMAPSMWRPGLAAEKPVYKRHYCCRLAGGRQLLAVVMRP